MALGGQHVPNTGIRRRGLGPTVGPGFQILQRVDDTPTEFAVGGTRAVGPMLFQGAAGQAEESRGFGRAQVTRRQTGVWIGHLRGSVIGWSVSEVRCASDVTMAECAGEGGCR